MNSSQHSRFHSLGRDYRLIVVVGAAIASVAGIVALFFLTWDQPIVDSYGFRQAQTALTVYWGIVEGWRLAYLTPVVGYPWSVPFEFPLYQWVVSAVWKLTHLPLDNCGRITSFLFHLLNGVLISLCLRRLQYSLSIALAGATLFLVAPVNLFWGRSFLIESCALFSSLLYIYFAILTINAWRASAASSYFFLLLATVFAASAALTKITTFIGPAFLVLLISLELGLRDWKQGCKSMERLLSYSACYLLPVLVALATTYLWIGFSDQVKERGLISNQLVSSALQQWNFGTLEQRWSSSLWIDTIWDRSVPETFGQFAIVALLALGIFLLRGRNLYLAVVLLATYLITILTFANLHIQHSYYQYAAAVWLVLFGVVVLASLEERSKPAMAIAFVLLLGAQAKALHDGYAGIMLASFNTENSRALAVAAHLRDEVKEEGVAVLLGLDWSSEVAYYSKRFTVAVPGWGISPRTVSHELQRLTRSLPVVAVVDCRAPTSSDFLAEANLIEGSARTVSGCLITKIESN